MSFRRHTGTAFVLDCSAITTYVILIMGGSRCRGKDKEIALLRAALVERDGRLQAGRAELLQARMQLQEKDEELVTAYQRLTEACQQRSAVRAALIGTQTELAATSAELDAWTHEIATFQTELAEMVGYPLCTFLLCFA